ncbi:MAG TPA: HigA family addiction module antidote protein [Chloroflexi bacterium]|nr:HigA family addiction module antidote protein [Chloroflexota bacterium]
MRERKRPPSHPGQILKELYLTPLGISNTKLAQTVGVSRKTISAIVNKRKSVRPEMALRLSRALDTSPELWLNLQKTYDLWYTAQESQDWRQVQPLRLADPLPTLQGVPEFKIIAATSHHHR